jgi:predicted PurR-regulated permease PerM
MSEDPKQRSAWDDTREDLLPYLRRLIVTIVVIGLALLLWQLRDVVLLAFAAILIAVLLLTVTDLVKSVTKLGHRWALTIAGLLVILVLGLIWWVTWPSFQEQLSRLVTRVKESLDQIETTFGITLPATAQEFVDTISGAADQIWATLASLAGGILNMLAMLIMVIFSGVYLAVDPGLYRRGFVLMFPRSWHDKISQGVGETGRALKLWLRAQVLVMIAVGVLDGIGAAILGLPAPLALGLIGGLTEFVPIIGPFVGAAPAVLVALSIDSSTLIWTIVWYTAVQQLEGNFLTPVLQRRIVSIPPVVLLLSFVALGILFGAFGIIVAAPLSIAIYVLVREFYVGDLLSERDQLSKRKENPPPQGRRRRRSGPPRDQSAGSEPNPDGSEPTA